MTKYLRDQPFQVGGSTEAYRNGWDRIFAKRHAGHEIVCPDGLVRLYPYHNEGDAKCDAEILTQRGCAKDPIGQQPPCPGGLHTVRAATMSCPEHSGSGEA